MKRILPYVLVLATSACAKQGVAVREPHPSQVDLWKLCADPRFACTPTSPQQDVGPVRVDTNLASPHRVLFAG